MIIQKFKGKHKICIKKISHGNNPLKKRRERKSVVPKINIKASWSLKKNIIEVDNPFLLILHREVRLILLALRGIYLKQILCLHLIIKEMWGFHI